MKPDRFSPPTRAWIVVGATFVTLTLVYGVWYSYAVFLVALLKEFGWSRSTVAGAFSVFMMVHGLLAPFTGWLVPRIGVRRALVSGAGFFLLGLLLVSVTTRWWHLYLGYGVVAALGVSFCGWIPSVVLIRSWFPHRFASAMGVASAGIGVGISLVVPLAQAIIDLLGWRWTFRLFGVALLAWQLPAAIWLLRDPPPTVASGDEAKSGNHWRVATALHAPRFWTLAGAFFTGTLVPQLLLVHQVAYLVDHHVPAMVAATVAGVVGVASIGGKVGWGVLSDRIGREVTYALAFLCAALSIGLLALAGSFPMAAVLYAYAIAAGLGYGVLSPVQPAATNDLFGGPGFSTIYGAAYIAVCAGGAFGAWVAGALYDAMGSYSAALWVGLLSAVVSPALLWLAAPRRPHPCPKD